MYSDSDDSDNDEDVNFDDTEEEKCSKESICDENGFDADLSRTNLLMQKRKLSLPV